MRATLHSVSTLDDLEDIANYASSDPSDDGIWLRLIIGPAGGPGEESFDVLVCTPHWLSRKVHADGPQLGRDHVVVESLDVGVVIEFLRHTVESVEGENWAKVADKLSRLGRWEFENYRP